MTEKEFYISAGKKVKELREKAGFTQDEIATKTGIDRTLLSKFENTGKKISAFRLKQIFEAMGISISELFDEKKTLDFNFSLPELDNGNGWQDLKARFIAFFEAAKDAVDQGIETNTQKESQFFKEVKEEADALRDSAARQQAQHQTT